MQAQRHAKLFRNGRNQALRIPGEFELDGDEAIIRKEGNKLIVEATKKSGLLNVLANLKPIKDRTPKVDEGLSPLDDVEI